MNALRFSDRQQKTSRIAAAVTTKVSEVLRAPVFVTDQRGRIINSSGPDVVGHLFPQLAKTVIQDYVRVPLQTGYDAGEVIVGASHEGEEICPRLVQAIVEMVTDQYTALEELARPHDRKDDFIHALLSGLIRDEEAIRRQALFLGMDLNPPRAVILVDAADYILGTPEHTLDSQAQLRLVPGEAQIRERVARVIQSIVSFFHLPSDTICAYLGNGEVAVLKASDTQNLVAWSKEQDTSTQSPSWANLAALKRAGRALLVRLREDLGAPVTIGLGRYHPGICGLARSYEDAHAALELGCRFHGANQVHCLANLGAEVFVGLTDEQTKFELATYLLGPLEDEPELLETLDTFFTEDCRPSNTAQELNIHRNTLSYRLDKVSSLTGLDPRCFDDAVQLRLALLCQTMSAQYRSASGALYVPHPTDPVEAQAV